jgi:hypothetical protein
MHQGHQEQRKTKSLNSCWETNLFFAFLGALGDLGGKKVCFKAVSPQ